MYTRSGTVCYWLSIGVAVVLIAAALLWNAWTFNQRGVAQRQLDALGVDPVIVAENRPANDREIDLLLDADRRGILEDNFLALLTDPQKSALAVGRRERLVDKAGDRKTSLIFGVVMILGGLAAYGVPGEALKLRRSAGPGSTD